LDTSVENLQYSWQVLPEQEDAQEDEQEQQQQEEEQQEQQEQQQQQRPQRQRRRISWKEPLDLAGTVSVWDKTAEPAAPAIVPPQPYEEPLQQQQQYDNQDEVLPGDDHPVERLLAGFEAVYPLTQGSRVVQHLKHGVEHLSILLDGASFANEYVPGKVREGNVDRSNCMHCDRANCWVAIRATVWLAMVFQQMPNFLVVESGVGWRRMSDMLQG
jgi:hypothetical protein